MMNELIYFETFTEGWRFAQMSNPYSFNGFRPPLVNPASYAAGALLDYIEERMKSRQYLWDSGEGDYVYGLS